MCSFQTAKLGACCRHPLVGRLVGRPARWIHARMPSFDFDTPNKQNPTALAIIFPFAGIKPAASNMAVYLISTRVRLRHQHHVQMLVSPSALPTSTSSFPFIPSLPTCLAFIPCVLVCWQLHSCVPFLSAHWTPARPLRVWPGVKPQPETTSSSFVTS